MPSDCQEEPTSMGELLVVAFLGGLITGLSPCIVPVIPVVVAGGSPAPAVPGPSSSSPAWS